MLTTLLGTCCLRQADNSSITAKNPGQEHACSQTGSVYVHALNRRHDLSAFRTSTAAACGHSKGTQHTHCCSMRPTYLQILCSWQTIPLGELQQLLQRLVRVSARRPRSPRPPVRRRFRASLRAEPVVLFTGQLWCPRPGRRRRRRAHQRRRWGRRRLQWRRQRRCSICFCRHGNRSAGLHHALLQSRRWPARRRRRRRRRWQSQRSRGAIPCQLGLPPRPWLWCGARQRWNSRWRHRPRGIWLPRACPRPQSGPARQQRRRRRRRKWRWRRSRFSMRRQQLRRRRGCRFKHHRRARLGAWTRRTLP